MYVIHAPMFIIASLALGQSYVCPSASDIALKDLGENRISKTNHTKHRESSELFHNLLCIWIKHFRHYNNQSNETNKYSGDNAEKYPLGCSL